ncbi:hypothetical protein YC2023_076255 [Brassica napus]
MFFDTFFHKGPFDGSLSFSWFLLTQTHSLSVLSHVLGPDYSGKPTEASWTTGLVFGYFWAEMRFIRFLTFVKKQVRFLSRYFRPSEVHGVQDQVKTVCSPRVQATRSLQSKDPSPISLKLVLSAVLCVGFNIPSVLAPRPSRTQGLSIPYSSDFRDCSLA